MLLNNAPQLLLLSPAQHANLINIYFNQELEHNLRLLKAQPDSLELQKRTTSCHKELLIHYQVSHQSLHFITPNKHVLYSKIVQYI